MDVLTIPPNEHRVFTPQEWAASQTAEPLLRSMALALNNWFDTDGRDLTNASFTIWEALQAAGYGIVKLPQ